jgi:hypothetical protein
MAQSVRSIAPTGALACVLWACACASPPSPPSQVTYPKANPAGVVYPTDAREFVSLPFFHGVPYDGARRLGPAAIPVLVAILADPHAEALWASAATTLGMIGDPQAREPLARFIQTGDGTLSVEGYRAKTCAIMALGYLANASHDAEALAYLLEGAEPAAWGRQKVAWRSSFEPSSRNRDEALAEIAIIGLALSGQAAAATALRGLEAQASKTEATHEQRRLGALASVALAEHAKIAKVGLAEYYR